MPYLPFTLLSLLLGTCQFLSPSLSYDQCQTNGIYFVLDEGRCLDNKVKKVNTTGAVCVPDKPLFLVDDISWISEPADEAAQGVRSLTIGLSEEAGEQLAVITDLYYGEELVLVLDNMAVFILAIEQTIISGEITLKEDLNGSMLDYTYKTLKEALDE